MLLPNNCSVNELNVSPANWNTKKADINCMWYIDYHFKDPRFLTEFPHGKRIRIKGGLNRIKSLKEKQQTISKICEILIEQFENGYNPFDNTGAVEIKVTPILIPEENIIIEVLQSTQFIKAFKFSLSRSSNVKETIKDTESVLNKLDAAAKRLSFDHLSIGELEIRHVKLILDECHHFDPRFSAKRFNKAKSYLSGLFKYLVEVGAAHGNMAIAISPMKEQFTEIKMFTQDEIDRVKEYLYKYNRPFYNFMMLFFHSGGRMKELMRLKGSGVDLVEQTYTVVSLKGKARSVTRTIRNVALPLWKEQMKDCKPTDYVFSKELLPGDTPIDSKQISKRWTKWVIKPLEIKTTFYKLKHLNADRTMKAVGAKMAAGQMGHTSTKMAEEVYAYNEKKRIHEGLKVLDIKL